MKGALLAAVLFLVALSGCSDAAKAKADAEKAQTDTAQARAEAEKAKAELELAKRQAAGKGVADGEKLRAEKAPAPKDKKKNPSAENPTGMEQQLSDWLTKGSCWWGRSYQTRPVKTAPQSISLIILERSGKNFKGDLLWNGRHLRYVAGTVDGEKIEWSAAPGERNLGHFNVGTIKGKRIDIEYFKPKDSSVPDGTLVLEHVPAKVAGIGGPRQDQLGNAALKIIGAALAHALAEKVANERDADAFTVGFVVVALAAHNAAIDSDLRDVFPRLSARQTADIRLLITNAMDGRLEFDKQDDRASKRRLIDDLRRIDPDLADAATVADFVYAIYQGSRRR